MNTESIRVIDQELEDVANSYCEDWVYTEYGNDVRENLSARKEAFKEGFKAGTAWQKEQSATDAIEDAIEFVIWTHKNLWTCLNDEPLWFNKNKVYRYKTECLTSKQLYELWQENQKKSNTL
jgi:hypothetical protein